MINKSDTCMYNRLVRLPRLSLAYRYITEFLRQHCMSSITMESALSPLLSPYVRGWLMLSLGHGSRNMRCRPSSLATSSSLNILTHTLKINSTNSFILRPHNLSNKHVVNSPTHSAPNHQIRPVLWWAHYHYVSRHLVPLICFSTFFKNKCHIKTICLQVQLQGISSY